MSFTKSFSKGRGVLAAAQRLNVAAEKHTDATQKGQLNVAQEGLLGGASGVVLNFLGMVGVSAVTGTVGWVGGGLLGGAARGVSAKLKSDIENISREITRVKAEAAAGAYKDGTIPKVVYEETKKTDYMATLRGLIFGTIPLVNYFYNADAVSELENLYKQLQGKIKELEDLARDHGTTVSKENLEEGTEGTEGALDAAIDAGNTTDESAVAATDITGETTEQSAETPAVVESEQTTEVPADTTTPEVSETPAAEPAAEPAVETPAVAEEPAAEVTDAPVLDEDSFEETLDTVEEVGGEAEEIGETVEKTDGLITDQETLLSLADNLDQQADDGGASPETIQAIEIAVEGIVTRMNGGKRPGRITPSMESFGGTRSKLVSTRLAAESIREWAAEAGKAIAEFFAKILAGIKALLGKLSGSTGDMKKQIAQLTTSIETATVSEANIKVSASIASRLKLGGKVSKETLFAGIARMRKFIQSMLKVFKANKATAAGVNLDALAANPEEVKINTSAVSNEIKRLGKTTEKGEDGTATVTYMEELPGDTTVDLTGPDIVEVDGKFYRAASSVDVNIESPATENEDGTVELRPMSKEETKKILADLDNLVGDLEDLESPVKETEGLVGNFLNWIKGAANSTKEGSREGYEAAKGFAQRMAAGAARGLSIVVRFVASYVYAALAFIKAAFGGAKPAVPAIGNTPAKLAAA
jgi:hypothetical protein